MKIKDVINKLYDYFKKEQLLVIWGVLIALVIYGIRIFSYNIGVDTDGYICSPEWFNKTWYATEGRFGLSILQTVWETTGYHFNMYLANLAAVIFLLLSCLFYCFLFSYFSGIEKSVALYTFIVFYMSSYVWFENIYFTFMAAEVMFGIMLCPIAEMMMWNSIVRNEKKELIVSLLLAAFATSTYTPIIAHFFAGLLILFIISIESGIIPENKIKSCLIKALSASFLSFVIYYAVNWIGVNFIFEVGIKSFLKDMLLGGLPSAKQIAIRTFSFFYNLCFAGVPIVNHLPDFFVEKLSKTGVDAVEAFHVGCSIESYPILFPALIISVYFAIMKYKNKKLSVYYILLWGILLLCPILLIAIQGGGGVPRYLHLFPLVISFLLCYSTMCIGEKNKINSFVYFFWIFLIVITGYYRVQDAAAVTYYDQRRFDRDLIMAEKTDYEISRVMQENGIDDCPVYVEGLYHFDNDKHFVTRGMTQYSAMMYAEGRPLDFMRALGYTYRGVDPEKKKQLKEYSSAMPAYPSDGWVQFYDGTIIVKYSEE